MFTQELQQFIISSPGCEELSQFMEGQMYNKSLINCQIFLKF
jgi:hypothetical protein